MDIEQVKIVTGDTDTLAVDRASAPAARRPTRSGRRCIEAAEDARQQTLDIAAAELEAAIDDLDIVGDTVVVVEGVPDKSITLGGDRQEGQHVPVARLPAGASGSSALGFSVQAPAFAAAACADRGRPGHGPDHAARLRGASQDVGKLINPLGAEGQMQGGAVQSLGLRADRGA